MEDGSRLFSEVLRDCGLTAIPSDEEISQMSIDEKTELHLAQKSVVTLLRDRSQTEVEELRARLDEVTKKAVKRGIPMCDMDRCESMPVVEVLMEDNPGKVVFQRVKNRVVKPNLLDSKRRPVLAPRSRASFHDRRIREINEEIWLNSTRFSKLAIGMVRDFRPNILRPL
jgi:hypothetical protein